MNYNFINKKFYLLVIILFTITITITGCISFKTDNSTSAVDGGVFKTVNKGNTWQQKVLIPTISGTPKNFSGINVVSMAMDPSDSKAIYFGSEGNGLFYTYDAGDNWQIAKSLGQGTIKAVAIDPHAKCIIYAAIGNRLYKSSDCNRTWLPVYYDNDLKIVVDAIAIDHYNSANVYIGVSRGDIIKSSDYGENWQTIKRLPGQIKKIIIDPNDSRNIYVIIANRGIYYSNDGGINWDDLNAVLNESKIGLDVRDLTLIKDESNTMFLATYYGLLKSNDKGKTWEKIELIPPEGNATINALAINPTNVKEIYYVTNTTFYSSIDGGASWATKKLPTTRAGWKLLIDPESPNAIYMGVKSF